MIKYFVLFTYLQITHQFSLVQQEDSIIKRLNQRNRRQLDIPDSDAIIFRDDDDDDVLRDRIDNRRKLPLTPTQSPQTTPLSIPGMNTQSPPCEMACRTTPEYNPVCGDDNVTYFSVHRLKCAQKCGKRVKLNHLGACTRKRWDNCRNKW